MDNAVFKTHFQTSPYGNKRKSSSRNRLTYREKVSVQVAICLFILMFAGIVKNANTNITNSLSDKISTSLSKDANLSEITAPLTDFLKAYLGDSSTSYADDDIINPIPSTNTKAIDTNSPTNEGKTAGNTTANAATNTSSSTTVDPVKNPATPAPTVAALIHKGIFITPATGVLGNTFGDTIDQLTQKTKSHKGLDIDAPSGTEIKAAASGIVIEAAFEKTLGYYVKIEHSNGYTTIYGQCSQLLAKKGQNVNQGDIIAKVGSTGTSTGSHLHFEIWKDGKAVNPSEYVTVAEK